MNRLYTSEGEALSDLPLPDYPRPSLRRTEWMCLNGQWEFTVRESSETASDTIRVPFCPESLLSGAPEECYIGKTLIYRRFFTLPAAWIGRHVLLHFGAVSRLAVIRVNGQTAGRHEDSYLPFTLDITALLQAGENCLEVEAVNDLSHKHPWGKQKVKRGGMWYTPVSGIWQTVWLEPVPKAHITGLEITVSETAADIRISGCSEGRLECEGRCYLFMDGHVHIEPEIPELWSPEHPKLYFFHITAGEDRIDSYFALRTLSTRSIDGKARLCLNGEPYFFNGLLDQGYWSDGLYTPADASLYEKDILAMKGLGFNTLRKHIKIEPDRFYYECDRLGMIVFQDMVNCGDYHFLRDTALPTIGIQQLSDRNFNPDPETRQNFIHSMEETVGLLKNHPCICMWTIFNEGWGQFKADEAYDRLKKLDSSRFIDSASGWFAQKKSDVESLHIYFKPLHAGKTDKPLILSEYGGYSYKIPEHSFNLQKTYGYRKCSSRADFARDLRALFADVEKLKAEGLCAAVYTQVSDVEDETNGLFTYDRKLLKIKADDLSPAP